MKNKIKNAVLRTLSVFILTLFVSRYGFTQSVTLLPLLNSIDLGYYGAPIEYNDSLYFLYETTQLGFAEYNGLTYRSFPSSYSINFTTKPFVYNGALYYWFSVSSVTKLGRVNSNGTITIFNNPDGGFGHTSTYDPLVYNGKLYFIYNTINNKAGVAEFDGTTVKLLTSPDAGYGFTSPPLVNNGFLYWAYTNANNKTVLTKYNGTALSVIGDPGTGYGVGSDLALYHNNVYFIYNDSLGYYDGVNINVIPMPAGALPQYPTLVVNADKIWFKVEITSQYQVAYYNGISVNLFAQPYNFDFGFTRTIIYDNKLYFRFDSTLNNYNLAKIEGNNIKLISRVNDDDPGMTDPPVIYNNNLYYQYNDNTSHGYLAKYDGTTQTIFPFPTPDVTQYGSNISPSIVYKGSLYGWFFTHTNYYLGKITDSVLNTSLCANGNLTLNSMVSGSTYQWQLDTGTGFSNISNNTNYSGTNTKALLISNAPSTWYGYRYRCIVNGITYQSFLVKFNNTWTGTVSNAWENPANWSCNIVPDANTDVYITSGTVVLNSNTTIMSLHISDPAMLTINTGNNLIVLH